MIAAAMFWMAATAALLALAARALEEVLRSYGTATRFVWLAALVASVALPVVSFATDGAFPGSLFPGAAESVDIAALFEGDVIVLEEASAATMPNARGVLVDRVLAVAWPVASVLVLALYALTWVRLARTRRSWRPAQIEGTRVLLSARGGPAVLGLIRPAIVVPEWLRCESADAQRLILLHECEHVQARDHALLALAPLFAIVQPWNPVVWWQLRRLRLAVEVDCDRRVLARGISPGPYGALLLDIAQRGGTALAAAAALAEPRTFLERRILAMSSSIPKLRLPRALALTGVAAALAIAACETTTPMNVNAPEPQPPEPEAVATVVEQPVEIVETQKATPLIIVDGVIVSSAMDEIDELTNIDHIEVVKGTAAAQLYGERGKNGVIRITTKGEAERRAEVEKEAVEKIRLREVTSPKVVVQLREKEATEAAVEKVILKEKEARAKLEERKVGGVIKLREVPLGGAEGPQPLFLLDGVIVDRAELERMSPADIESIEVVKGAAAAELYGARGKDGVINITTKR